MSSRGMMRRLATAVRRSDEADDSPPAPATWPTEDELADQYEAWHAEGGAAGEGDVPRAIAFLRASVAAARESTEPLLPSVGHFP